METAFGSPVCTKCLASSNVAPHARQFLELPSSCLAGWQVKHRCWLVALWFVYTSDLFDGRVPVPDTDSSGGFSWSPFRLSFLCSMILHSRRLPLAWYVVILLLDYWRAHGALVPRICCDQWFRIAFHGVGPTALRRRFLGIIRHHLHASSF